MLSRHRRLLGIALPVVASNLVHTLVLYTDFFMVGKLSSEAIVAVGMGLQIWGLFYAATAIIYTGESALLSRFVGGKQYAKGASLVSTLLIVVVGISVPIILFWQAIGRDLFILLGADAAVTHEGVRYLYTLFWSVPFVLVNIILYNVLTAMGQTKIPLYISFSTLALNVVGDYILIFGHLGFPAMGVEGAAIVTLIAGVVETVVYLYLYLTNRMLFRPIWHFSSRLLLRVVRVGIPAMIERMMGSLSMLLFSMMVLHLGTQINAAFQLGLRIEGLAFMPGFGFAMAASILMGQGLGAKDPARSEADVLLALRYTVGVMLAMSGLFVTIPEPMIRLFTEDMRVIEEARYYLLVVAFSQIPLAYYLIMSAALKGAGDTRRTFWVNTLSIWIFRLLPGAISVYGFDSIIGIYLGLIVDPTVKAAVLRYLFYKGKWRSLKI
jgi:putative MATE family efflux protein